MFLGGPVTFGLLPQAQSGPKQMRVKPVGRHICAPENKVAEPFHHLINFIRIVRVSDKQFNKIEQLSVLPNRHGGTHFRLEDIIGDLFGNKGQPQKKLNSNS